MTSSIKESIRDLVSRNQHVTFAEMQKRIPGFEGDVTMILGDDDNLVLWPWLSEAAFTAINELREDGSIHAHPCETQMYRADRLYPRLPFAERPPKEGYATEHWFPVCFCDYPPAAI